MVAKMVMRLRWMLMACVLEKLLFRTCISGEGWANPSAMFFLLSRVPVHVSAQSIL
jgi:hypothetical protein